MKYDILIYGNPMLREKAKSIENVDDGIRQLAKDMLETMYDRNGLGLAAEQIGRTESICVIDVPSERDAEGENGTRDNPNISMPLVMINPRITGMSGEQERQEGCLSFPELFVSIKRAAEATVTFTNLRNEKVTADVRGLLARTVQHEIDHLDGILMTDRMSFVQKVAIAGKLKKLKKMAVLDGSGLFYHINVLRQ